MPGAGAGPPPEGGQQTWLPVQQLVPQQLDACGQKGEGPPSPTPHGAGAQLPPWQTSPAPQAWPQVPQFWVSVERSTQRSPAQQDSPCEVQVPQPPEPPPSLDEPEQLEQTHAPQPWGTATSVQGDGQKAAPPAHAKGLHWPLESQASFGGQSASELHPPHVACWQFGSQGPGTSVDVPGWPVWQGAVEKSQ